MDYRLRVSTRARRLCLRVTCRGELEVVLPRGLDPGGVPALLQRERAWIERALARVERRRQAAPPPAPWRTPDRIDLPALGRAWHLTLRPTAGAGVRAAAIEPDRLRLSGRVEEADACRRALLRWLGREAEAHLVPWLERLGRRLGLRHGAVTIRFQRSRWGSCSPTGAISLNARLLLLPPPLVEYVLVHELCHTRVRNHSPRFWALLSRHCPEQAALRAALRAAGRRLPGWADGRAGGG